MNESPRLDRIEQVVTALEVDIKTMSSAVNDLAVSIKQLVDLQTDQKLLRQELEHRCEMIQRRIDVIEGKLELTNHNLDAKTDSSSLSDMKTKLAELEPLLVIVRYPKLAFLGISLLYLMSVKEIRDAVLSALT